MRPPRHGKDNFVGRVAEELKPWNVAYSRAQIVADISAKLDLLRACHSDHFERGAIRHIRDSAREIIELTELLKQRISRARFEIAVRLPGDLNVIDSIAEAGQLAEAESLQSGRRDQTKEWCAKIAGGLKVQYSTELPTIKSMMKVTPIVYEAVTGNKLSDLRRSCEAYVRFVSSLTK